MTTPEPKLPPMRDIVQLMLPLPLEAAGKIMAGICDTLEAIGYTDVSLRENATHVICARPPAKWTKR